MYLMLEVFNCLYRGIMHIFNIQYVVRGFEMNGNVIFLRQITGLK